MNFYFEKSIRIEKSGIQFIYDNWNDFGYKTYFESYYIGENGSFQELGHVNFTTLKEAKLAYDNKNPGGWVSYTAFDFLQSPSTQLDENTISLGSINYYESLYRIFPEDKVIDILTHLNDISFNLDLYEKYKNYDVITTSLLRGVSTYALKQQLHRIAHNGVEKIPFNFSLEYSHENNIKNSFTFKVDPNSSLPTNVYCLIGNNGTGKTTVIQDIVRCYLKNSESSSHLLDNSTVNLTISDEYGNETFESILYISFSAFDQLKNTYFNDPNKINKFKYIGNSIFRGEHQAMKSPLELANDLLSNIDKINESPDRIALWKKEILKLSFDSEISHFIKNSSTYTVEEVANLSAGQKMILLGLSALVSQIEEKTLIIIDEPESYLHPPLVSAYIRILSDILGKKNGVAIIATHSPVILQEIPKSCVWILERDFYKNLTIRHPRSETFGESINIIMDDIFGLDIRNSGFYQFLSQLSKQKPDVAQTLINENSLGSEASLFMQIFLEEEI